MIWLEMIAEKFWQGWAYLSSGRTPAILAGIAFALLAIILWLATKTRWGQRTRWGQSKTLTKCIVLSILAHVWLLMYALGNRTVLPQGDPKGSRDAFVMTFEPLESDSASKVQLNRSDRQEADAVTPQAVTPQVIPPLGAAILHIATSDDGMLPDNGMSTATVDSVGPESPGMEPSAEAGWEQVGALLDLPRTEELVESLSPFLDAAAEPLEVVELTPLPEPPSSDELETAASLNDQASNEPMRNEPMRNEPMRNEPLGESTLLEADFRDESKVELVREQSPEDPLGAQRDSGALTDSTSIDWRATSGGHPPPPSAFASTPPESSMPSRSSTVPPPDLLPSRQPSLPTAYQLRQASQRLQLSRPYGADEDSEAAVEAALRWLADAQSPDGSWNAARFGAGTETRALGEYRHGTGGQADTGVTGLALLAFLSAGHTHLDGAYRSVVAKGLSFLLQIQMPSGDLSGPKLIGNARAAVNARMYCHSIALLSLAEAHAMTQDPALVDGVTRGAQFSINAQDSRGGGWRYHPGDSGDLSLFGWKAMALHSADLSGIKVPPIVGQRMQSFLRSCTVGRGGLARYRPGEGRPSETMTAEALACRLLLDFPLSGEARREAVQMIMSNLPGETPDNVYYWYYATLALFQLQDENWQIWNQRLKSHLLQTQIPAYRSDAGSWNPDSLWGGYGGRVYSTAMSCLCLEVYYRYLPMYQPARQARLSTETF
jgi:hypothetical protein